MRTDLLDIIACPLCKGRLTLDADAVAPGGDAAADDEILDGGLTCGPCGERYPIADSIPNLLPPELRDAAGA